MRSIIFANYIARDTRRLGATSYAPICFESVDVEHSHVRFLGNLVLNLWDCGGQEVFMENYIASQRDQIFRNVEILLDREQDIKRRSHPLQAVSFGTSIWDETLYKAWSAIVYSLIPNVHVLETHLNNFCRLCEADEVILFERTTFLVISHATRRDLGDVHRFEKVSNIIKQFKLSCSKSQAQFQTMEVCTPSFSAFLQALTPNTYAMVIVSDPTIQPGVTLMNISAARSHFESIE
ncbi:hypothetical protein BSLG_003069 [Batrachochytrium salamandrivorans]|nr:hypothetical protein BSLG_003069 [Batrachochytrium salamandrivorans]